MERQKECKKDKQNKRRDGFGSGGVTQTRHALHGDEQVRARERGEGPGNPPREELVWVRARTLSTRLPSHC